MTEPAGSDFGRYLRGAREASGLGLDDVARLTRVRRGWLELIDGSCLDDLPAEVFVRGFVRAYARAVGADEHLASRMLEQRLAERSASLDDADRSRLGGALRQLDTGGRRRVGVALAVIVLLIAATLMVSMLLRRPGTAAGPFSSFSVASVGLPAPCA